MDLPLVLCTSRNCMCLFNLRNLNGTGAESTFWKNKKKWKTKCQRRWGKTVCCVRILNGAWVLQYVSVPTGHITDQYQEGSGRGQKRAGLDLAQKLPSCVRLSIRNGSLLKGGSRRGSEEGPRERPGKTSTNTSKAKTERRTLSERMTTQSV